MNKTIDDIYAMCDSRYALVNLIASKAREVAEDAEKRHEQLLEKPVNIVLGNLMSGKAAISKTAPVSVHRDIEFEPEIEDADEEIAPEEPIEE